MWFLIVSIPDLCTLTHFDASNKHLTIMLIRLHISAGCSAPCYLQILPRQAIPHCGQLIPMNHFRFSNNHIRDSSPSLTGFYTKMNVWGSLGLNFEYDEGHIIEIGGPIFLYKLRILEGSTSFHEGSVLSPGQ